MKHIVNFPDSGTFPTLNEGGANLGLRSGLAALVLVVLGGCSTFQIGESEFSCPGIPNGVHCMSTREAYEATNDGKIPAPTKQDPEHESGKAEAAVDKTKSVAQPKDFVIDNYVAPRMPNRPIPVRTPAQVMRIWVAPWEDTNGDLIAPGYVYTEIEPRRWVIGDQVKGSASVLRPLQSIQSSTKQGEKR